MYQQSSAGLIIVTAELVAGPTDNFPTEPNYMGSRQQFVQSSSTFKDPERASLRDSGHGDSDQADSDQDTNKGSCCDMSAKEALKMKATGVKPPPLEQVAVDTVDTLLWYVHTGRVETRRSGGVAYLARFFSHMNLFLNQTDVVSSLVAL
ncbi:Protocadherin-17 [Liparis tanakae]|uniref:Protocadherin-17 n=1 Tax=Liparis tanakae TaxID=230148 RepID=A0A4Z2GYC2_9TELE|nr:Protocadherin-17 [Liparis tanakae]